MLRLIFFLVFIFNSLFSIAQEKTTKGPYLEAVIHKQMGEYELAAEKFKQFVEKENENKKLVHYAYGELGICLSNIDKDEEALPYLTRYIRYFNGDNIKQFSISNIDSYVLNIGEALSSRGFCRGRMGDTQGAIEDQNMAVIFFEMLLTSDKFKTDKTYNNLAFSYYIRGMMKCKQTNSDSGCPDLRKASVLGNEGASKLLPRICQ